MAGTLLDWQAEQIAQAGGAAKSFDGASLNAVLAQVDSADNIVKQGDGTVHPVISQATAEAGTSTDPYLWSSLRVAQSWHKFSPSQLATPAMQVQLAADSLLLASGIVSQGTQTTGTITAPTTNPRIDRVVIDSITAVVSVITGTEAASPTPPALTAGKIPVCQVALVVGQTSILDSDITYEFPALWGYSDNTPDYTSSSTAVPTAAGATTFAHGIGSTPTRVTVVLICVTTEGGYAVGDEIDISSVTRWYDPANATHVIDICADATNVTIVTNGAFFSTYGLDLANKSTGAAFTPTAANWNVIVRAWK